MHKHYIFTNFICSSYGETEKNKNTFKTPEQFTRNYELYGPLKIPMDQLLRFSNNYHEDKKKTFVQHDDDITKRLKEMSVEDDDPITTPTSLSSASNTLSPMDSRYNSIDYSDSDDDTSSILSDKDFDTNTFSETSTRTDRSDSTCSSASVKRLIARRERRRSS